MKKGDIEICVYPDRQNKDPNEATWSITAPVAFIGELTTALGAAMKPENSIDYRASREKDNYINRILGAKCTISVTKRDLEDALTGPSLLKDKIRENGITTDRNGTKISNEAPYLC